NYKADIDFKSDDLKGQLTNLIYGKLWNDNFYRDLINKITVYEDGNIGVSFRFLKDIISVEYKKQRSAF
ncbi:MAG: hypothetical protein LBI03_07215, partial [Clostridiales bacterium]|nr:hypothetical protein [Clostridiales bacterium]